MEGRQPALRDERIEDVSETALNLATVAERGVLELPELTDADLCVLGGAGQALVDEQLWTAWAALPDHERGRLERLALESLVQRGLLDPPEPAGTEAGTDDGTLHLRARPPLAMILTARRRPSVLVVCSVEGQQVHGEPRMFGLAEEGVGLRAVLAEQLAENRIRRYLLASPPAAARMLATWAAVPYGRRRLRQSSPNVIDVYRHDEGAPLTRDRMTIDVEAADDLSVVRVDAYGVEHPAQRMDRDELAERCEQALTSAGSGPPS